MSIAFFREIISRNGVQPEPCKLHELIEMYPFNPNTEL